MRSTWSALVVLTYTAAPTSANVAAASNAMPALRRLRAVR
jgi:hypothetical protein